MNEGERYLEITALYWDINNLNEKETHKREIEIRFNPFSKEIATWSLSHTGFSPLYEQNIIETKDDFIKSGGISIRYKKLNE